MNSIKRMLSLLLCLCMVLSMIPMYAHAEETAAVVAEDDSVASDALSVKASNKNWFDTSVTDGYYNIISEKHYGLTTGAEEAEIVLNNSDGSRRQVVHVFRVDGTKVDILPGYYGIDKDVTQLENQTDSKVTDTAKYYEDELGYELVGGMNIALAYDSNAPYTFLVYEGKVLADFHSDDPLMNQHTGSCSTYLAIFKDGTCELRSKSVPLTGEEWHAVGANFGWLVKDGALVSKTPERTSSPASRSMLGILPDGSLIMCMVDGRGANNSVGLSNYEMGEFMLALGCVNAVNGDGGGSSTFISKREGEVDLTMRSVPSDGAERPTLHSVFLAKKEGVEPGTFDHANIIAQYDYFVPATSYTFDLMAIDTTGAEMEMPEGGTWSLSDDTFGTISADGTFTSNGTLGTVSIMYSVNGTVAEKTIVIADPLVAAFVSDGTVLPYGKSTQLELNVWADKVGEYPMYYQADSFIWSVSDENAGILDKDTMSYTATEDESYSGVSITIEYAHAEMGASVFAITYGKGSEILFDFEDGSIDGWMGFVDAKQWSIDNGVNNTLVGSAPLGGQFSEQVSSTTFLSSEDMGGKVKNGEYALAWSLDNTDASFAGWTYNVLFYVGEQIVLRDVANGKNPIKLGMWLYIPENAPGLAFQSQLYTDTMTCKQDHFTFITANGTVKNLNSCTEADIPESRWVYASINLTAYDFLATPKADDMSNSRSPSIIRTYVKPAEPAVITFYIDDITLDYSSAVDDRVLPTISNVSYATADESVEMANGAVISGNSIAFSAKVADNAGLNYNTGAILVDGVSMNASVKGGVLSCDSVKLNPGAHTVTFEIQDKLGNLAKVTRDITIAGDAVVTLSGHNDSGTAAEYDSVYYADINVADITAIDTLTTTIYLQTANTWEPEGIKVAEGFEAEYSLNEVTNELTVTVKRVGETSQTGSQLLVSLPIRVWSWNGFDYVTGKHIAAETQFATGYCPIVQIRYNVVYGQVTFIAESSAPFGGFVSVDTNLNDNINPWHYHDEELVILNQEATCTTDGCEGRTYCQTCQSVVDWGTKLSADGHSDDYDYYSGVLACPDCGEINDVTGLIEHDGFTYYAIAGHLQTRWHQIDEDWYYFFPNSYKGAWGILPGGSTAVPVEYTMDNGRLTSGIWVEVNGSFRYYYGPDYYRTTWATIDGEKYYFDTNGYRLSGYNLIKLSRYSKEDDYQMYLFAEDGRLQETLSHTGLLEANGHIYYLVNGIGCHAGLIQVNGAYYYIGSNYIAVTGEKTINEPWDNDLLPCGTYTFGEDGKMICEEEEILNGIVGDYYYIDGVIQKTGLIKIGEDYYYFSTTNGVMSRSVTKMVYRIHENCDLPQGEYTFGADGKMIFPEEEVPNGIIGDYYYINGVIQKTGLIKIGEDYYYFSTTNGVMSRSVTKMVYRIHESCNLPQGEYTFGADGKVIFPEEEVLNGIVGDYYYIDGVVQKSGLIKIGEDYYYFSTTDGIMSRNVTKMVYRIHESCDLPKGEYTFGADGKVIFPEEEVLNGIVGDYYYIEGVIQKTGLIKIGEDYYYFSTTNGVMSRSVTKMVYRIHESCNLPQGEYTFGADGKVIFN